MPRSAINCEMNSGWPGQAAPVTKFPSVKQRSIGSGSNQVAPERTTLSFTAGYAVHFLPCQQNGELRTSKRKTSFDPQENISSMLLPSIC